MSDKPRTAEEILAAWADLRVSLEELDKDLTKNLTKGNVAAGRRARSGFRDLKKAVTEIMKDMVALEKAAAAAEDKADKMGLFKGLPDKPYTKADYYREMEERQAAKMAARVAPVVVVPVKDPEWLEPEDKQELASEVVEQVVIPYIEPVVNEPVSEAVAEPVIEKLTEEIKDEEQEVKEIVSKVSAETLPEPKKVTKTKRKKS